MKGPTSDLEDVLDLANIPTFTLGGLTITPSTREVEGGGEAALAEPRALQVLIALYQAGGKVVSRDELVRRCWGGRIVGEDAINRAIAKARHLADLTDPAAFAIETIPRVGYRLKVLDAVSPPLALDRAAPTSRSPSRRTLALTGGAILAAAGVGAGGLWWSHRPRPPGEAPLVAVLPFDNLSLDPQLGYFADGLAEDILDALTRAGGLRVLARSSSFAFRGAQKANAATTLGAGYLLDGAVTREGARLRVSAHLSDARNQQTLWSQTYDREAGQELQIEDDIALQVASALKARLTLRGARSIDPAVFDLYLKGKELNRQDDVNELSRGNDVLKQAVERAPAFAAAWFELAKNRWHGGFREGGAQRAASFAIARDAAQRALALDADYGAAYGVLSELSPRFHHWGETEAALVRGLALSPADPDLAMWRGAFLAETGRLKAAVEMTRRAWDLDPLEYRKNQILFSTLNTAARFAEADVVAKRVQALWPRQSGAYWDRFWVLAASGREMEAAALLDDPGRRSADELPQEFDVLAEAMHAASSGSAERRRASADACLDLARFGIGYAGNSLLLLGRLGEDEAAVELARSIYLAKGSIRIDRSVTFRSSSRPPIFDEAAATNLFHPLLARIRRAGRFDPIFDGIGLTAFWRASGPPDPA